MAKVTGIGGIFVKCGDKQKMKEWYAQNLGLDNGDWGANFEWLEANDPSKKGSTVWSLFPPTTKNFDPSTKEFMINYRVDDIEAIVEQLKAGGATMLDEIAVYEYGKFVHVMDPEGNKIELWEPAEE